MDITNTLNLTKTMRSVKQQELEQNVKLQQQELQRRRTEINSMPIPSQNYKSPYYIDTTMYSLEHKMELLVNKLNEKEIEAFSQKQTSRSNNSRPKAKRYLT
jgi:hypothetical protein|tara:strand:- start:949 stop:1254 length:306 start_codon:yes stop_codon:yes gene_type:complete